VDLFLAVYMMESQKKNCRWSFSLFLGVLKEESAEETLVASINMTESKSESL